MYHLTKYIEFEANRDYGYFDNLEDAKKAASHVEGEEVHFLDTYPDTLRQYDERGNKVREPYFIHKISSISLEEFKKLYS